MGALVADFKGAKTRETFDVCPSVSGVNLLNLILPFTADAWAYLRSFSTFRSP
ncbi:hypothetical protein AS9A_1731 [Hoyosella subflava DQS3-9A1]|uniref:Uncharacterized protein n=1 Tax=Hoyosella subflava (strain DSM 45089 / JCM 17490 / NBRC 109087 / DQS3-9A1) TaxID=443218 RepID=F6EKP4_HOYSD|nr:hypothetical protein AS9A_1731 [Hoyosella subflava DQS3-9A1]